MRPLVLLLALCALLFLCACQSGSGPSSALDLQPAVGGGARVFAGPEDGVGGAAQLNLGRYGLRTGRAAEPSASATRACPDGECDAPFAAIPPAPVPETAGGGR
ncbi:MAG: hypothetical protein KDB73_12270 [Planctomycetes bacterium]|nr:hypothetical protein [Planctomycetota bacterium]